MAARFSYLRQIKWVGLQGKGYNITGMMSGVNAFQEKLKLWIAYLNKSFLSQFPYLISNMETNSCDVCDIFPFISHLDVVVNSAYNIRKGTRVIVNCNNTQSQWNKFQISPLFLSFRILRCNFVLKLLIIHNNNYCSEF